MFDPHNNQQMYEGHIPEATLFYNHPAKTFHLRHLLESTSMVMSPVDILKPDYSVNIVCNIETKLRFSDQHFFLFSWFENFCIVKCKNKMFFKCFFVNNLNAELKDIKIIICQILQYPILLK